jgi:hypothetical protein
MEYRFTSEVKPSRRTTMPINYSTFLLPSGARCVRADCSGALTKKDLEVGDRELGVGGSLHGLPILSMSQQVTSMSSDARKHMGSRETEVWTAVVVTNPVIRVTANFLMRVTGSKKQRLFTVEAEAIQWLDERAREDEARAR